ncbi:uncharacterized protein A1O5_03598 [Cladophialophora psammophila CBS 110553]|uniref:Uncharacterized protein n=1 Tax=Cladophialophora psammophila CBS 110553 TaxID=1182543 RepID=W9XAA8_9EURO|nr:uncharacterized protein A1O5_03598 [Cladophialophora psammophila CBS 110553]EXJ73836.1 hypothetical protein A1O5_03598 [Cladophialophora psammophila CBS 110553]
MRTAATSRGGPTSANDPRRDPDKQESKFDAPRKSQGRFQQQFEFIEGLNSKAQRKKTRSWVTTQHYRRKRYDAGNAVLESGQGLEAEATKPSVTAPNNSKPNNEGERHTEDGAGIAVRHTWMERSSFLQRLGGGRADPFNSYPVPATRDVHALVDHCGFPRISPRYTAICFIYALSQIRLLCDPLACPQTLGQGGSQATSVLGLVQPLPQQ